MLAAVDYSVEVFGSPDRVPGEIRTLLDPPPTPFQGAGVAAAWYASHRARTDIEPLVLLVTTKANGAPVFLLHFVCEVRDGLRIVGFADQGLSDNNAPVLGPAAPRTHGEMHVVWQRVKAALPPADVIELTKQPGLLGGRVNPLTLLPGTRPSPLTAHPLVMPDSFEDYVRSRDRHFRKEQGRVWRVFQRHEGARFVLNPDPSTAETVLAWLDARQAERMAERGAASVLDEPSARAFYRTLLQAGLGSSLVMGALLAGDEPVGAILGVAEGRRVTFVRVTFAGGEWRTSSPGRLVIEKTLEALHAEGVREVDFSIGDYPYKTPFGIGTTPLYDRVEAVSLKGLPRATLAQAKAVARGSVLVRKLLRR